MRDRALTDEQIAGVEIRTFHMATRLARFEPASLDEFSYGIAYLVAALIMRAEHLRFRNR